MKSTRLAIKRRILKSLRLNGSVFVAKEAIDDFSVEKFNEFLQKYKLKTNADAFRFGVILSYETENVVYGDKVKITKTSCNCGCVPEKYRHQF